MTNVSLSPAPAPGPVCPPGSGWVVWLLRRLCVYVGMSSRGHSWSETLALCRAQHPRSGLVSVHSEADHRELHGLVEARDPVTEELGFWLGGVRPGGGAWAWQDGSQWGWAAWLRGQPSLSGRGDMCVKSRRVRGVTEEPYWYDIDCDNSLDPTVTEGSGTKMEMWHNVAALLVLGCGAILIVICLVKYGLRQWRDMGEDGHVTTKTTSIENLKAGGIGDRNFVEIREHQSNNESPGGCGDQCHCCHECPRDDKRRRNPKRMSNIESKILKKKSREPRDSNEMIS